LNVEDIPDIKINIEDIKGADGRKNIAILKILSVLKSIMIFKNIIFYIKFFFKSSQILITKICI
tara:strand:- start:13 stop:204 length:192 start_codon:yes stop_codon:yes gene_type:complete